MDVAILFSGGKDSCYSIMKSKEQNLDVKVLLTFNPVSDESWLFHHPCTRWTTLQAKAMGIPIVTYNVESQGESEKDELRNYLGEVKKRLKIEGIVSGAIASQYQKTRIEEASGSVGLKCFTPLWKRDPLGLLREQLEAGLEILIVAVAALGFDQSWLGRRLDEEAVQELARLNSRYGVNPTGEGGEYETFVLDSPLFGRRIAVRNRREVWLGDRGRLEIEAAELVKKG